VTKLLCVDFQVGQLFSIAIQFNSFYAVSLKRSKGAVYRIMHALEPKRYYPKKLTRITAMMIVSIKQKDAIAIHIL